MIESLFTSKKIIDITPVIGPEMAVFPGDQPFERDIALDFSKGDHLTLSSMKTSLHIGAHTDAPNHYAKEGVGIDQVDLAIYMGPCQVITINLERGKRISSEDFKTEIKTERILFRTLSFPDPNNWNHDFVSLDPALVESLAKKGVKLVGIDTPSVDPADDKELLSHTAIWKNKMAILEGIVLNDVEDGTYELLALPIPIKDADASPVRAILIS